MKIYKLPVMRGVFCFYIFGYEESNFIFFSCNVFIVLLWALFYKRNDYRYLRILSQLSFS